MRTLFLLALLVLPACGDTVLYAPSSPSCDADDADCDGSGRMFDCDDEDPAVLPGAPEVCNGADDNCDGRADEDLPLSSWYYDADNDGHGDPEDEVSACRAPASSSPAGDDCDDGDPESYPGAPEIADGLDNDCDGISY